MVEEGEGADVEDDTALVPSRCMNFSFEAYKVFCIDVRLYFIIQKGGNTFMHWSAYAST